MDDLSPVRRTYYGYLSRMYALTHRLSRRSFLGLRLSTWARWLPILALLIGWRAGWPPVVLGALLIVSVWINYSMWRAKRDNFNRFVSQRVSLFDEAGQHPPLPANERLPVLATGLFSVSGREDRLLLRPAQYWRVPLGDHVIMVEEEPGKYLYQFFNGESLQELREGLLLSGPQPRPTLSVSFMARWGPEYTRFGQAYETGPDDRPPAKRVTIYLSAEDETIRRRISQTIVGDARQARLSAGAPPIRPSPRSKL